MKRHLTVLLAFLSFVLPLFLYLKSLAPTYIPIDSAEFTLCMYWWGICHPPGFPLYTFIGHIFLNVFPFGETIFKANLFSALWGSLTVLFIFLTLLRLNVQKIVALFVSLIFSVNSVFWEFSIAADVFSFGTFLVILFFYLSFSKRYFLSVFVLALTASHFYITAILAPILYWFYWGFNFKQGTNQHIRRLFFSIPVFISGFFPQALMYFRMQQDPPVNWGSTQSFGGFISFLRREEFGSVFLLSNPSLTFSPVKVFGQIIAFFQSLFSTFAFILVIFVPLSLFINSSRNRNFAYLSLCLFTIICVQLVLLGTLEAPDENSPFQLNKFYLNAFAVFTLLIGMSVDALAKRFFQQDYLQAYLLLGMILALLLISHLKPLNYSNNHFSENMVWDALEQLPPESIGVTVSHIMYFGGRYEQEVNGNFKDVTLLYFPNEKNRDSENYVPQVVKGESDQVFVAQVKKGKNLGKAEEYILDIISKNLDKEIYILQGTFEESFFSYLKPYISPYGLWWKVQTKPFTSYDDTNSIQNLYSGFRNDKLTYDDLHLKQQRHDLLTYAVAYNTYGVFLGASGKYDEAISYLERAKSVRKDHSGVKESTDLLREVKKKEEEYTKMLSEKSLTMMENHASKLFTIGNFARCEEVYTDLISFSDKKNANYYNNLAICQVNQGKVQQARENWNEALKIDPTLAVVKKSLEDMDK